MHPKTLRAYRGLRTAGRKEWTSKIDNAAHWHVSTDVYNCARRILETIPPSAATFPKSSFLPAGLCVLTFDGDFGKDSPVILLEHRKDGFIRASLANEDGIVPFAFRYQPGTSHYTQQRENTAGLFDVARVVSITLLLINTPNASVVRQERGSMTHRQKIRSMTGRAPTAWTVIDQIAGGSRGVRESDEIRAGGRLVALHRRKAHWAWVPSQRKTPKGVWLDDSEAGARGSGWYVPRPERIVGTDAMGVRAARNHVRCEGAARLPAPALENDLKRESKIALAASQRALIAAKAGMKSPLMMQ